jgi:UDP-GlcNAc:undecaprenyl-phosphate/decaprenyl-phosphate GlcNAc-1-phosphate transferase
MSWLIVLAGGMAAAAVMLLAGRLCNRAAWYLGLVDHPKLRGVHARPVARSGGLLITLALLAALAVQLGLAWGTGTPVASIFDDHLWLLVPALMLVALGVVDDIRPLGAPVKLLVQGLAAVTLWQLGFRIEALAFGVGEGLALGWWSLPLTVLFVVAVTNAFNMIDGVDGLCTAAAAVTLAGLLLFAGPGGLAAGLLVPLAVAAAAFLRENVFSRRAFLGDSGSMLLGFVAAALCLRAVSGGGAFGMLPALLLLSLPVVDLCFVVVRRLLLGTSPFTADRGHLHHILLFVWQGRDRLVAGALAGLHGLGVAIAAAFVFSPATAVVAASVLGCLYLAIMQRGGYLAWTNLRNARNGSRMAGQVAAKALSRRPHGALACPEMAGLLKAASISAIQVYDEHGEVLWHMGAVSAKRDCMRVPLRNGDGCAHGELWLQVDGPERNLAFAVQLLHPLYPAFHALLSAPEAPVTSLHFASAGAAGAA